MTKKEMINFKKTLIDTLRLLTPSWHTSKSYRATIAKILIMAMLMNKLSHRLPLELLAQTPPQDIEINIGEDGILTLSELWSALSPIDRAILIFFELQVPQTGEELLDETPGAISLFFEQARDSLFYLPAWDQIVALSQSPNLPASLPEDTKEFRVSFTDDETITFFVTNESDETRAMSFEPDLPSFSTISNIDLNVYSYQSKNEDIEMLDTITEDILFEVFDLEPSFS